LYQFLWHFVRDRTVKIGKHRATHSDSRLVAVEILLAVRTIREMILEGFAISGRKFV
jgi:hypothetical protein